ncbi:MAG: glycosyltransferase family 39 protein [Candidatus Omnitrophota bacterium]|nr:glycosyltransferase family 39 protein [Candidatus Omnitrophota bacterium]
MKSVLKESVGRRVREMRNGNRKKILLLIIIASLIVKFALFGYAAINAPSAKFMPDTATYMKPGINLVEKGVFATFDTNGEIKYEINRTPGYPLFIAFLNRILRLSPGHIIIAQILFITLAGYFVYKAASELDKNIALLSVFIFLFDLPTIISTLQLLTEALYTVFMAFFIFFFLKYLEKHTISTLIRAVLMLVIATYIRPVSYYLGICLAGGIIYVLFRRDSKKAIAGALVFLLVFYSLLGLWHYRNYVRTGDADFTVIDNQDLRHMGLTHKYERDGGFEKTKMSPLVYYLNHTARSVIQFFTLPGTLKHLKSRPLKIASKIYGYPWVIFWLIGIFFAEYDKLAYRFLLLTVLYFAAVSIIVTGLCVGSRFRVPVMPFLSILSASGWMRITGKFRKE